MFTTFIVQPIFNLLVLIYNLLPGHNFGLAIIIFTIVVRLAMWPLVKKQLYHAKAMRDLAPELKKIKAATGGDRQQASKMTMELYKEKQINPFATIGIVLVQAPILIGLYFAIQRLIKDPQEIINFSYNFLHFGWLNTLASNIHQFDSSLFGLVDLTRSALGPKGTYWPALVIVALSAIVQFVQSKQLMPAGKDARSLKKILSEAGKGKQADQSEVNAAVGRGTLFLIPGFVFIFGLQFAAALPLYWLVSSGVALVQQSRILKKDVVEAEAVTENRKQKTENKKQKTISNQQSTINNKQKAISNQQKTKTKKRHAKKRRRR